MNDTCDQYLCNSVNIYPMSDASLQLPHRVINEQMKYWEKNNYL